MIWKHSGTYAWKCATACFGLLRTLVGVNTPFGAIHSHASWDSFSSGILPLRVTKVHCRKAHFAAESASSIFKSDIGRASLMVSTLIGLSSIVTRYLPLFFGTRCGAAYHDALGLGLT